MPNEESHAAGTASGGHRHRVAICLSGGGFRSAIFHLGAFRRLHELGILREIRLISSVSGGSIFSAFFATAMLDDHVTDEAGYVQWVDNLDFEKRIAAPFRAFVGRDLRTWPFFKHVLWNWALPRFRARDLENRYADRITRGRALGAIPEVPEFIFCATDLTFGINWEFRRDEAGSYLAGYLDAAGWPMARAVAASACFPPLFGPMRIKAAPNEFKKKGYRAPDGDRLRRKLDLSDGGVYDNMGLEPAWKNADNVLVSDCGAPFGFRSGGSYLGRLMRYTSVVTNQALALRKRIFFTDIHENRYVGTRWALDGSRSEGGIGYSKDLVDDVIERVRTDLNAFTDVEFAVLVNHGYAQANAAIQRNLPVLITTPHPASMPYPDWVGENEVRKALSASHKRLSVKRLLQRRGKS